MNNNSLELPHFDLDFNYALGKPTSLARFRTEIDDFIVQEHLGFELTGSGEHLCLLLQKRGENTGWIAEQLARLYSIRPVDVGYCGLKDRHANTTQWFSLHLPKPAAEHELILQELAQRMEANITVLNTTRHNKKLRRGSHAHNHFQIVLRDMTEPGSLPLRLQQIAEQGVPNYFGEQRFGNHGSNLHWAYRWMTQGEAIRNRGKRVMAQSAARSWLFNRVLSARVANKNWQQDWLEEPPTGPLWGRGRPVVGEPLAAFEQQVLQSWSAWQHVLEHAGLSQERRALVLQPQTMQWQIDNCELRLSFALPPGAYATAVLRELCMLDNQATPQVPQ